MMFAISLSFSLLILIFSVLKLRNLHLFEMVLIWVVITFLFQIFVFIVAVNLEVWRKPEQALMIWAIVITRLVGMPFLVIWFFELCVIQRSILGKAALMIGFTSLLVAIDYLMHFAKILHIIDWSVWQAFAVWFAMLAVCWLCLLWYRTVLKKEALL